MPLYLDVLWDVQSAPVQIVVPLKFFTTIRREFRKGSRKCGGLAPGLFHSSLLTNRALTGYTPARVCSMRWMRRPVPVYPRSLLVLSMSSCKSPITWSLYFSNYQRENTSDISFSDQSLGCLLLDRRSQDTPARSTYLRAKM